MLSATIDSDGSVRRVPGSSARFRVVAEPGWITVYNHDDQIIVLNGAGVGRIGHDVYCLKPGKMARFRVCPELAEC
jgi:uncharacterized cupin superfamily protein